MNIRRAKEKDMESIDRLLCQVLEVHHSGRPDLFKGNTKKYTDSQLAEILRDDSRPVFVAEDENVTVQGYVFCVFQCHEGENILTDIKTLYIDDLCVDENLRGGGIGYKIFEYVKNYAKEKHCYNLTLNVWALNESAKKFYEKCGLKIQKYTMENIL